MRSMKRNGSLTKIPFIATVDQKNLREYLVRAKIKNDATTTPRGISKCPSRRNCYTCQHIQGGTRTITFYNTNKTFDIRQSLDCNFTNLIYLLQCKQCLRNKKTDCQKTGRTGRRIRDRLDEHRRDTINRRSDTSRVAKHFCKPGHLVRDLQLLPLLQIHDTRESVRRAKEAYFIGLAKTLSPNGLNRTTDR